jgi:N-acetylneuraminic acid mutarotase
MRIAWLLVGLVACGDDGGGMTTVDAPALVIDAPPGGVGTWTTGMAVAHGAIQETAAVAVAGKVYVIGGFEGQTIVRRVQVYDTAANTWSDGPDLPVALHHANAATDGRTIYVLGALGNNFAALAGVYSLNPATDTQWMTRAQMPAGRERGAAVTDIIDGKIYVAGGFRQMQASALVDVYDPVMNMWAPLADLPATRDHACGAAIGGQLHVVGGRTVQTNSPRPDVWSYDPGTNMWSPRAPMPTGRGGMGCGAIGGKLYATGGEGNPAVMSGVFPDVEAFDPATNTWTELAAMPNPKHGVGGAVWNGALYLCGGANVEGFGAIAAVDVFKP